MIIYREFPNRMSAEDFIALLASHHIESVLEAPERVDSFSKLYGIRSPDLTYKVKIKNSDLEKINAIIETAAENEVAMLPEGHFLLQFSDAELQQMIACPEEWSREDYAMARQILKQKGIVYTDAELAAIRDNRFAERYKPKHAKTAMILAAYVSALAGGLIGFVTGWHLWMGYIEDPDGNIHFIYDRRSRTHGLIIFLISVAVVLLASYLLFSVGY